MEPFIIGIAGGTGSGKTLLANSILEHLPKQKAVTIQHDSYYKDTSKITSAQRHLQNYDHPDALDNDLLVEHLTELIAGRSIKIPCYDFTTHRSNPDGILIAPSKVILIEGILIFAIEILTLISLPG